jgi:hypothetical protein
MTPIDPPPPKRVKIILSKKWQVTARGPSVVHIRMVPSLNKRRDTYTSDG